MENITSSIALMTSQIEFATNKLKRTGGGGAKDKINEFSKQSLPIKSVVYCSKFMSVKRYKYSRLIYFAFKSLPSTLVGLNDLEHSPQTCFALAFLLPAFRMQIHCSSVVAAAPEHRLLKG